MEHKPKDPEERNLGQVEADDWEPSLPVFSDDGGVNPAWGEANAPRSSPSPPITESMCGKGPCRHYWELVIPFEHGNAEGTFAELNRPEPRQTARFCLASPASDLKIDDTHVEYCSKWDPLTSQELAALEARREEYYQRNPHDRPDAAVALEAEEDEPDES